MKDSRPRVATLATVLLGLAFGGARATYAQQNEQEKDLSKAFDTILDENASLADRERAITLCGNLTTHSRTDAVSKRKDDYRRTLETLLKGLGAKPTRTADQEKVAVAAFVAIGNFFEKKNFTDLAKVSKPFLAKGSPEVKVKALSAIERSGGPGAGSDIATLFDPENKEADARAAEKILFAAVRAARGLPGNEALDVLIAAVKKADNVLVKKRAIAEIGDFVLLRKPKEYDRGRVVNVLGEVAKTKGIQWETGDAAALALLRHNSFDGMPPVMERLAGKSPQRTTYGVVCVAAQRPDGWGGVTPKSFDDTPGQARDDAIAAAGEWWGVAQRSTPEKVAFEALAAEGVSVPKDAGSREYVGALIDGLSARSYSLRNAVLDVFVQKTGRTDFALRFKSLRDESTGGSVTINIDQRVDESIESDPKKLQQLMTQQEGKARKLREAWDKIKDKATYDNGVWNAPWESVEPKDAKSPRGK